MVGRVDSGGQLVCRMVEGGGGVSPAERYMAGINVSFFKPLWIGSLVS